MRTITFAFLWFVLAACTSPVWETQEPFLKTDESLKMSWADPDHLVERCNELLKHLPNRTLCSDLEDQIESIYRSSLPAHIGGCNGCPVSFVGTIAKYTAFYGLTQSRFDAVLDQVLREQGRTIIAGNRQLGLLVTDWGNRPDKQVGTSMWKV